MVVPGKSFVGLILLGICSVLMLISLFLIFSWVPTEMHQGIVQRIFYFHVPSAWVSFLGFFCAFIGSIGYLSTRREKWDAFALTGAEIGVVFCTIVLITGPLWAKPVWGIYWTWDARLTTTFILWLIFLGYLLVRIYTTDQNRRASLAAVVAIVGFLDVPIVYFSIRWWRTLHPQPVFMGGEGSGLAPEMLVTFMTSLIAMMALFVVLYYYRYRLEILRISVDNAYRHLSAKE